MISTQQSVDPNLLAFQDGLRSVRSFVTSLHGSVNDQSWAGEDSAAYNTPYRYTAQGPNGVAVEGTSSQAVPAAGNAGLPPVVMLGLAALVVYFLVK